MTAKTCDTGRPFTTSAPLSSHNILAQAEQATSEHNRANKKEGRHATHTLAHKGKIVPPFSIKSRARPQDNQGSGGGPLHRDGGWWWVGSATTEGNSGRTQRSVSGARFFVDL